MNVAVPAFMMPLADQAKPTAAFLASPLASELTARELAEVGRLMACQTSSGAVLTFDREATRAANEARAARREARL